MKEERRNRPEGQRPKRKRKRVEQRETLTPEEVAARRDRIRRQRIEREKKRKAAKKKKIIAFTIVGILAAALIGALGYGIYCWMQPDHLENATEFFAEGNYEEAKAEFELATKEEEEELDEVYLGLALCYWELGEYESMELAFDMAYVNGATMTGSSRNMLASLALQEEDYETALTYIEAGLTCAGNSDELTQELMKNEIICYEMLQDWETAYEKALAYCVAYPDDEEAAAEAEFLATR